MSDENVVSPSKPSNPLVQSLRDHAINVRASILREGPYAKLFERAADEIERLTKIVKTFTVGAKRAGYDCPDCHKQILFGDSICPVTKELHANPSVETNDDLQHDFAENACIRIHDNFTDNQAHILHPVIYDAWRAGQAILQCRDRDARRQQGIVDQSNEIEKQLSASTEPK